MAAQICDDRLARQPADDLRRAQHRPPHRLVGKGALLEIIEDDVVGRVVGLPDLLQDDGALAFEFGRIEGRVQQDVGENVERERQILLQHLGVIRRAFARGIGVEVAADRLDLLGDRAGAAPLGALERHVLEKMRDAVDLRRLVPCADIDPQPERDRVHGIDAVGDDAQPVRQRREPGCHVTPPGYGVAGSGPARVSADEARDRIDIVRQNRRSAPAFPSFPPAPAAFPGGCRWRARPHREISPDARVASAIIGVARSASAALRTGGGDRDRGMRIDQQSRCAGRYRRSCRGSPRRRRGGPKTAPARARQACSSAGSAPVSRNRRNAAVTAAPLRPFSSNSRRSKLLATWMSMLGLRLGITGASVIAPLFR